MKKYVAQVFVILLGAFVLTATFMESEAQARAGGSRSMGSRGARSYSPPSQSSPYRQAAPAPRPSPFQQPQQGGFMRGMMGGIAGGMIGGMLGGMLFRGTGMAGGMGGYGGPGLFDILLLAGIGYLIYRFVKKRREAQQPAFQSAYGTTATRVDYQPPQQAYSYGNTAVAYEDPHDVTDAGLSHIRQMDVNFDESRFKDTVMDLFFKIQGAWMNRDLMPAAAILTDEMRGILQQDVQRLLQEKRINRLENIAVRSVEITEAWQESGNDFITTLVYANLLDYTTDESGAVVEGNKTDPVKFEEYWTFTRPVGPNPWKLSAIQQV